LCLFHSFRVYLTGGKGKGKGKGWDDGYGGGWNK
jgi:hypothetical protein